MRVFSIGYIDVLMDFKCISSTAIVNGIFDQFDTLSVCG
jgi:hypothetical protein